jgi:hypothetical protein
MEAGKDALNKRPKRTYTNRTNQTSAMDYFESDVPGPKKRKMVYEKSKFGGMHRGYGFCAPTS